MAVALFGALAQRGSTGVEGPLFDATGRSFTPLPEGVVGTGAGLGVLLLGGWLLGKAAQRIGLSKITGYLAFGVLASPKIGELVLGSGGGWVLSSGQVENLELVNELAIALIALTAGGEIHLGFLRERFKSISLILVFEFSLVLLAVAGLMTGMLYTDAVFASYGGFWTVVLVATVIGIVATANSPAVVIAIIGESGADGPMARTALSVTVCKDLLLIVAFAVALAVASNAAMEAKAAADAGVVEAGMSAMSGSGPAAGDGGKGSGSGVAWSLTKQLGGSMLAGALIGVVLAWYVRRVNAHLPIVLVLGSFVVALVSKEIGFKTLIVGLSAGVTMANVYAERTGALFERVEELSVPVYAVFFALAGTKVDPGLLVSVWPYVLALVVLRGFAVWGGTGIGCALAGVERPARSWVWTAFVPQAGISLALAVLVEEQFSEFGFSEKVFGILLSAIAINELLGPILLKFGFARAGEAGGGDSDGKGGSGKGAGRGGPRPPS